MHNAREALGPAVGGEAGELHGLLGFGRRRGWEKGVRLLKRRLGMRGGREGLSREGSTPLCDAEHDIRFVQRQALKVLRGGLPKHVQTLGGLLGWEPAAEEKEQRTRAARQTVSVHSA